MTVNSMTDEQLLLYYYDDGLSAAEKEAVRVAIDGDPVVAARYRQLCADLDGLAAALPAPLPEDLRQRLYAGIDAAAAMERQRQGQARGRGPLAWFLYGASAAATVAVAIAISLRAPELPTPPTTATALPPGATVEASPTGEPVFMRAMQVYFRDSQQDLLRLPDSGNGERTALILDLVAQNRSFEKLADRNDAGDLARVLRAFEPILLRLAADDITVEESEALRSRLAFELNVMLTKLTREASEFASPTEQET